MEWRDTTVDKYIKHVDINEFFGLPGGDYVLKLSNPDFNPDPDPVEITFSLLLAHRPSLQFRVTARSPALERTLTRTSYAQHDTAQDCDAIFRLLIEGTRKKPWTAELSFTPDGVVSVNRRMQDGRVRVDIYTLPGFPRPHGRGRGLARPSKLPRLYRVEAQRHHPPLQALEDFAKFEHGQLFFKTKPSALSLGAANWEHHATMRQAVGAPQKRRAPASPAPAPGHAGSPDAHPPASPSGGPGEERPSKRARKDSSTEGPPPAAAMKWPCFFGSCPSRSRASTQHPQTR